MNTNGERFAEDRNLESCITLWDLDENNLNTVAWTGLTFLQPFPEQFAKALVW